MSDNAAKEDKASEEPEAQRRIRDIQKRDLMVVRHLISDYPGFSSLNSEDQLDRIVLVLESICGYGAVSVETIGQLESVFPCDVKDIGDYFQSSQYDSSQTGEKKHKYRESFEGAFRLEREYKKNLSEEGDESENNEPIRKKVPPKPKSQEPVQNKMQSPKPQPKPKAAAEAPKPGPSAPMPTPSKPDQILDKSPRLSTEPVDKADESTKKSPMPLIVGAAVAVVVIVVIIAFAINS